MTIGELARRAGLTTAAVRWYEAAGLVHSERTTGNQRRYRRSDLRRLAVVAAGQRVGLSLAQIATELAQLPDARVPTQEDWAHFGVRWRELVQRRIEELTALRDDLDGCIGCGCLSLQRCTLFNADDAAAGEGPGSRWLREATEPDVDPEPRPAIAAEA